MHVYKKTVMSLTIFSPKVLLLKKQLNIFVVEKSGKNTKKKDDQKKKKNETNIFLYECTS